MRVEELDFALPEALIAQSPPESRDGARLLLVTPGAARFDDRMVTDLPTQLPPSLFVLNDTKVIPARLLGQKPTGGKVEILLVEPLAHVEDGAAEVAVGELHERWLAMGRASKGLKPGATLYFGVAGAAGELRVRVDAKRESGELEVTVIWPSAQGSLFDALDRVGHMPLPPYIRREDGADDRERYQTVFAETPGAIAAPTAGLHLSERLIAEMTRVGHRFAKVTLHVGPGTFAPIKVDDLDAHPMHSERYEVTEATAQAIAQAKGEGRPVVAVGTTVVRTLESAAQSDGSVRAGAASTNLLIQPPYEFKVIDALMTNFHLPKSTLLALVMALGGVSTLRAAYTHAVEREYRFFSYGDAMLIRPRPQ